MNENTHNDLIMDTSANGYLGNIIVDDYNQMVTADNKVLQIRKKLRGSNGVTNVDTQGFDQLPDLA